MKAKRLLSLLLAAAMGASVLTGCNEIKADAVGATLNGEEISLGFMNFMAKFQQAVYDGYLGSMYGTSDYWSQDMNGNGSDMETTVKAQVAENIELLYLLEDHMSDYGVEITDDEMSAIDEAADKFMSDNSKVAIEQIGATKEYVKEMLRLDTIQTKMNNAIGAEVDTEVSDEEAAQKTFSYVKISKTSTTDADGKTVEYTDEQKKELENTVNEYAKKAQADFDGAAQEAGYTVSTYSYGSDESNFAKDVIAAADSMQVGDISDVLEDDNNYYIIRMDSTFDEQATANKKTEIVKQRKTDHYKEVCDGYKKDAKYEVNKSEWKKVKFDDLFSIKQDAPSSTNSTTGTDNTSSTDTTQN